MKEIIQYDPTALDFDEKELEESFRDTVITVQFEEGIQTTIETNGGYFEIVIYQDGQDTHFSEPVYLEEMEQEVGGKNNEDTKKHLADIMEEFTQRSLQV